MKIIHIFVYAIMISIGLVSAKNSENKMLFISTNGQDEYTVNTLFSLSKRAGFNPSFSSLYTLNPTELDSYKTIIISFDSAFFLSLARKSTSPLLSKGLNTLEALSNLTNKTIILLFPSTPTITLQELCLSFCFEKKLLPELNDQLKKELKDLFMNWLMRPDTERSARYDTALLAKDPHANTKKAPALTRRRSGTQEISLIPPKAEDALGIYLKNPKNNYILTKNNFLLFAEINEVFIYNPLQFQERQKKLMHIAGFLDEIKKGTFYKKTTAQSTTLNQWLPHFLSERALYALHQKNKDARATILKHFSDKKIWLGWTELRTYKNQEAQSAQNILNAKLNSIWIELIPEWYFGQHGAKKDKKDEFMHDLTTFITALAQEAEKLNAPMPLIFAGTNITSNFYKNFHKNVLPESQQTIDYYGTRYTKVPAPLDRQFWYEEVIDPLQKFIQEWQSKLPNIPLGGIFFDFEMYLNDQTGEYDNTMDYSDNSWHIYAEKSGQPDIKNINALEDRISFLLKNNKIEHYLKTLEQDAYILGTWLKQSIKKLLPNALIGVYSINLPYKWFYLGMFGGLSDAINPIILATFNNEFYPHLAWLSQYNIHAVHLPAFMLSKLRSAHDTLLIEQLARHNDGVWFNRISHWQEDHDPKTWPWNFATEVCPLSTEKCVEIIAKTIKKAS